jgi:alanine racemase
MADQPSGRSVIGVDMGALRRNVRVLNSMAPEAQFFAVVKADGYGHGAVPVARAALDADAAALCVATLAEARELRDALGEQVRIIILFPLSAGEESEVDGLEVVISTPDGRDRLLASGPSCGVHVKVDTGMGRWGLSEDDGVALVQQLPRDGAGPVRTGVCSHLATADDPDPAFLRHQLERFLRFTARVPGVPRHLANSAATIRHPETHVDAVRCGIAMYGGSPFGDEATSYGLEPVMTWSSSVEAIRHVPAGGSSGYGRRFIATEDTLVALVPVGYADGYFRALSGRADVLIRGRRRRVIEPISMDQMTVIVDEEVRTGDPVILIGAQGGERVSVDELARLAGSLPQEIVCSVTTSPRRASRRVIG